MSPTMKARSCIRQVLELLQKAGTVVTVDEMVKQIPYPRKTIHTQALALAQQGLVEHLAGNNFRIKEGTVAEEKKDPPSTADSNTGKEDEDKTLDPKEQFAQLIKSTGVKPEIGSTITNMLFNGNWDDLNWIKQVLLRNAVGFVSIPQARMIITSWSQMRRLPFKADEFDEEHAEEEGKGTKPTKEGTRNVVAAVMDDAGIGWKVGKDKDGDWVPLPGGHLTYEDALVKAEHRAAIKAISLSQGAESEEPSGDGSEGRPAATRSRPAKDLRDTLMEKMFDWLLETKAGGGDGDSEVAKELREQNSKLIQRIDNMEKRQQEERWERLEGMVSELSARDPWDDPRGIAAMRQRLGIQDNVITDASPVVQLIKDQSNKIEKIADRFTGIIERVALHPEEFRPEKTRTAEENEKRAGELLNEVQQRDRIKTLRQRAFGV